MKKIGIVGAGLLAGLACLAFLHGQEHPAVAAGASETAAKKLHDDLGQGKKILVIDVRTPKEFADGHLPGAVNIPLEDLKKRITEMKLSKDTLIVTMCEHGGRSWRAALELEKLGYRATSFCRLEDWKKAGYRVEKRAPQSSAGPKAYKFTCRHYCQSDREVADLDEKCDCACDKPYRECRGES